MSGMHALIDSWAGFMLAVSWQLAGLAILVWLCERLFKLRQPRVCYVLWLLVLLAPFVLAPGRMLLAQREVVMTVAAPAPLVQVLEETPIASLEIPSLPVALDPQNFLTIRVVDVLLVLWLAGVFFFTVRLLRGHGRVRQILQASQPIEEREVAAALRQDLQSTSAEVRRSALVQTPFVYGLLRPVIVLPEAWLSTMPIDDLRALLAHEVAHVARHDLYANLLQRLLEILLFFHPLVWLASRNMTLLREQLCDDWAVKRGGSPAAYAHSLLAAAEQARFSLGGATVGVFENKFTFLKRVESIMRADTVARISTRLAIVLVLLAVVCVGAFAAVRIGKKSDSADIGKIMQMSSEAPLNAQELRNVLSSAGISTYRFNYQIPYDHRLLFRKAIYVNGKCVQNDRSDYNSSMNYSGATTKHAGQHSDMIITRTAEEKFSFTYADKDGSWGTTIHLPDYGLSLSNTGSSGDLLKDVQLEKNKEIPVYAFVMSKEGGLNLNGRVEDIIKNHDGVVLISIEITPISSEEI